jgi:hypothetical protein
MGTSYRLNASRTSPTFSHKEIIYQVKWVNVLIFSISVHIVTCRMFTPLIIPVLDRIIGFINTSVTQTLLITLKYKQYSAITDLHRYNSLLLTH